MAYDQTPGSNGSMLPERRRADVHNTRLGYSVQYYPEERHDERPLILEYLQIIRRHFVLIAVFAALGLTAGAVFTLSQPRMYRSRTTLDIQEFNENILASKQGNAAGAANGAGPAESYIQTEIKILQSDTMAKRAITKLSRGGKPTSGSGTSLGLWSSNLGTQQASGRSQAISREAMLAETARNLKVRTLGLTRIVEVSCDAQDPRLAAEFCNTLAEEYIQQNSDSRHMTTKQTGEWLSQQLEDLRARLAKSEEGLQESAKGAVLLTEGESLPQEKLRQVQNELSLAQAERVKKQSFYEMTVSSSPEVLMLLFDGPVREHQVRLTDMKRQLAELSSTLKPAHFKVRQVESQIAVLETTLEKERAGLIGRARSEYDAAKRRENLLAAEYATQVNQLSGQAGEAVQYNMLKRQVESGRKLYETMLHRVEELGLSAAMRANTIRVLDRAAVPVQPFKPNWLVNCLAGILVGMLGGASIAFFRSRSDRSLQEPGDAPVLLSVRELGVIPAVSRSRVAALLQKPKRILTLDANASESGIEVASRSQLEFATWHSRNSLLSESFSATMNSILFADETGGRARIIVVTSPELGDGKTTVSSNLAISLAQIRNRVLLIDGDLRKPRLTSVFDMLKEPGLVELLRGDRPITPTDVNEFIHETCVPDLYILPSGDRRAFDSKLLHSQRMRDLDRHLRATFDVVIIDSPPMAYISDARVFGRLADGVLLVFRAGHTTLESAIAAQRCLAEDGTHVLGTILNNWNPNQSAKFRNYPRKYSHAPAI